MLPSGGQGPLGIRNIGRLGPWGSLPLPTAQQACCGVVVRGSVCVCTLVCNTVCVHESVCLREKGYVCVCVMRGLMFLGELITRITTVCCASTMFQIF